MNMTRPAFLVVVFAACCTNATYCQAQIEQFQLENGIRIVVNPIANVDDVGVESFYDVGFIDEPSGMTQVAHLLEHLICFAPGAGYQQNDAMKWLNTIGSANAETLPDFTHYDYAVPKNNLVDVFKIEAARLSQTEFDRALIEKEAKRVYQETDFVEANAAAGMLKHAFMALAQSWNHQSDSALVRGGLEDFDSDAILEVYRQAYRPDNLRIIVTGNTTFQEVKQLAESHLANIPSSRVSEISGLNWSEVPAQADVRWDSAHSAVCIAWTPPNDKQQQVLLSVTGTLAAQKIATDSELKDKCHLTFCSNTMWHVGDLPFFVYALAKEGESLADLERMLQAKFASAVGEVVKNQYPMIKGLAVNFEMQLKPTAWARIQQGKKMLEQMGRNEQEAVQMVLLQDALSRGILMRLLGDDPNAMIEHLKSVGQADLESAAKAALQNAKRHVVRVLPNNP